MYLARPTCSEESNGCPFGWKRDNRRILRCYAESLGQIDVEVVPICKKKTTRPIWSNEAMNSCLIPVFSSFGPIHLGFCFQTGESHSPRRNLRLIRNFADLQKIYFSHGLKKIDFSKFSISFCRLSIRIGV